MPIDDLLVAWGRRSLSGRLAAPAVLLQGWSVTFRTGDAVEGEFGSQGDVMQEERALPVGALTLRVRAARPVPLAQPDASVDKYAGLEETYLAHGADVYWHVNRMIGDEVDAEDLTLAAFEKALRAWERRPPEEGIRPWLFRIATNCGLDELRRRKRLRWQPWDAFIKLFHHTQVAPDDPVEEVLRDERADLVHAALASLSPRHRAALLMRVLGELSNVEVARALDTSPGGAKMVLFRARECLRSAYVELGGELPDGDANL